MHHLQTTWWPLRTLMTHERSPRSEWEPLTTQRIYVHLSEARSVTFIRLSPGTAFAYVPGMASPAAPLLRRSLEGSFRGHPGCSSSGWSRPYRCAIKFERALACCAHWSASGLPANAPNPAPSTVAYPGTTTPCLRIFMRFGASDRGARWRVPGALVWFRKGAEQLAHHIDTRTRKLTCLCPPFTPCC